MSAKDRPHADFALSKEDFDARNLKHASYNDNTLAEAVIEYNERLAFPDRSKWAPRQLQAWKRLKHEGTWHLGNPNNYQDLYKWFEIFDDACFNGLLRGLCQFQFVDRNELGSAASCHIIFPGEQEEGELEVEKPEVTINLATWQHKDPYGMVWDHLTALLHEMLHAFFDYYSCCCPTCREERQGHGRYWQMAAKAVEKTFCVEQEGFSLGIKMDREEGMAVDIVFDGAKMPKKHELQELDLDENEIREVILIFKKAEKDPTILQPDRAEGALEEDLDDESVATHSEILSISPAEGQHTPRLLREMFESGMLQPQTYSEEDISATLIKFWGRSKWRCGVQDLMPRQRLALKQFKASALWRFDGSISTEELKTFFQIFDNAYFNGLLSEFCILRTVQERSFRYGCGGNSDETWTSVGTTNLVYPGHGQESQYRSAKPRVVITVPTEFYDIQDPSWRPYYVHDALLHQMIHAFFHIYELGCDKGCGADEFQDLRCRHSALWDAVVSAMRETDETGRKFLGLNLSLSLGYAR